MAQQYYKKAIEIFQNSGFVRGSINPCLYIKKSAKGIVHVALYVNDNLMIGDISAIDNAIEAFKNKVLVLKNDKGLQDYLSCKIKFFVDKKRA